MLPLVAKKMPITMLCCLRHATLLLRDMMRIADVDGARVTMMITIGC